MEDRPAGKNLESPTREDDRRDGPGSEHDELLRLASVVAHQLRSPLNAVQTVLGSVLGGFAGPLDPRQRWLLEKAFQRCDNGVRLVKELLKLRSVDQLEDEALGPVDLRVVFSSATHAVSDAATQKDLHFEVKVELPDTEDAWVLGESGLVREVLMVILDNAVRYTPGGGKVGARLLLQGDGQESRVCVETVDTGIGIPPEAYEKLFHEFYRAPNARQLASEGTGLGLAFAWRAVRRLGGELKVVPADGCGTRALVCLPLRSDLAMKPLPDSEEKPEPQRKISRRVIVIGGVAAGAKAAAKIGRLDPNAKVTIVERGRFLAYSGCGLPYYISGVVSDQRTLLESPLGVLRNPAYFRDLKHVETLDLTEAIAINRDKKTVLVRDVVGGGRRELEFDSLILATGARSLKPDIPGVQLQGIHTLHGVEDAEAIRSKLRKTQALDVVIVGGGLLGCQIAEAVALCGARITLVEKRPWLMPLWDPDLSALIRRYLEARGVRVLLENGALSFEGSERVDRVHLEDGGILSADLVLLTTGLEAETELARSAGLELGETGAIRTDDRMRTSDPSIFAAGDCAEARNIVNGAPAWFPGASAATLQGRIAAVNACGGNERYPGVAGTVILKVFGGTAGRTGLSEEEARKSGFDPVCAVIPGPDRAHFVPTASSIILKLVVDRGTRKVLGAQGIGLGEVAKRIDVVATALMAGMDVDQVAHLHLAYAPAFSMAMDNVQVAANVVRNKLDGYFQGISSLELWDLMRSDKTPLLLDVRQPAEYSQVRIRGSRHIPVGSLRGRLHELPKDEPIVVMCSLGLRAYEAALVLADNGFTEVRVLDGGLDAWPFSLEKLM